MSIKKNLSKNGPKYKILNFDLDLAENHPYCLENNQVIGANLKELDIWTPGHLGLKHFEAKIQNST